MKNKKTYFHGCSPVQGGALACPQFWSIVFHSKQNTVCSQQAHISYEAKTARDILVAIGTFLEL